MVKDCEALLVPNPGNRVEDFIFEKIEKKKPQRLSNIEYLVGINWSLLRVLQQRFWHFLNCFMARAWIWLRQEALSVWETIKFIGLAFLIEDFIATGPDGNYGAALIKTGQAEQRLGQVWEISIVD